MAEAPSDDPSILTTRRGGLGIITLNRPRSINALDHEMALTMERALRDWATDDEVTAVLVRGAGERGLCAGGDIVAIHADGARLSQTAATGVDADHAAAQSGSGRFWRDEYRLNDYIAHYPKPYIAVMDGIVMGGGVGISAHGNTRIVTDRTRLAMPEVGIGFIPDVGGTHLLARVPDHLGTYLALTAAPIDGAEAIALGLADHYVPAARLDDFAAALETSSVTDVLTEFAEQPPAAGLLESREWIAQAFDADDVGTIIDRVRAADPTGKVADRIAAKSPSALAVTLASLQRAATEDDLAEALRREYRVSVRALLHADLAEGIRAQVIDKDRNPAWAPVADAAEVAEFLAPLPADAELDFAFPRIESDPTTPEETSHV